MLDFAAGVWVEIRAQGCLLALSGPSALWQSAGLFIGWRRRCQRVLDGKSRELPRRSTGKKALVEQILWTALSPCWSRL